MIAVAKICKVSFLTAMDSGCLISPRPVGRRSRPAGTSAIMIVLALAAGGILAGHAEARRELVSEEKKARLKAAERIHLETVALATEGTADASGISAVATTRLAAAGYTVVSDQAQPHDITVKVKCEERKVWEGTARSGGDADLQGSASRLWRGPACQITYRMEGHSPDWRHEVRGDAVDAKTAAAPEDANKAMAQLADRLTNDPFPLLLAGAWGQEGRLLRALDDAAVAPAQKLVAIDLLGDLFSVNAIPALSRFLGGPNPDLAQRAAIALGAIGHQDCIPVLMAQLAHQESERRLAAIKGLGRLAPLHPHSDIVPALLERLPKEPIPTQTEIVRALGRTPDRRMLEPLRKLNRSVQDRARSDSSPELKELNRALGQALDQYSGTHTDE